MNSTQRISAAATAVICAAIVLYLLLAHLAWNPGKPWPPEPEPYIELAQAEEFIVPEEIPLPPEAPGDLDAAAQLPELVDADSRVAPATGAAIDDAGAEGTPAREVTSNRPSPVKMEATPAPAKPGPATEKPAEKTSAAKTNVSKMFERSQNKHNANNKNGDTANSGSPDGRTDSAGPATSKSTTSGVRKGTLGGGWQWPEYARVTSSKTGSIIFEFIVDKRGKATKIVAIGGEAPASADATLQKRCREELQKRTFSRPASAGDPDAETPARITFTFK